ncbi:MAG: hypothetical protein DI527_18785 [Chelatococcus sp.]|nr:MAG: hypothetical protein DI527_18785 [Chelatococcus sp.]
MNDLAEDVRDDVDTAATAATADGRTVPLHLLDEGGDVNVRRSAAKSEIEQLLASIIHRGLLQPLVVAEVDGRYKVGAGNRRLRALKLGQKRGVFPTDHPVKVEFALAEDLHEISLTENVVRVQLHPVDEFEAFAGLRESDGLTIAQIADRFGLAEKQVRQRLALGGLAPEVRKAWRDGKIGQAQAQAFTLCADLDVQRQALAKGLASRGHWDEWEVNRILRADRDLANSGAMTFVGREAYLAAGGRLTEDLFGDVSLVEDPAILKRLRDEKLAVVRHELLAAGWAFADNRDEVDQAFSWPRLALEPWMTDEERAALKGKRPTAPSAWSLLQQIRKRVAELPEARAQSGVLFELTGNGQISLDVLRLRPEPEAEAASDDVGDDDDDGDDDGEDDGEDAAWQDAAPAAPPPPNDESEDDASLVQSKPLLEDLSEQLGDAIAECLIADPALSLRVAVAALTSPRWGSPVRLVLDGSPRRKPERGDTFATRMKALAAYSQAELAGELARALTFALETRASQAEIDRKLGDGIAELVGAIAPDAFRPALARAFDARGFFDRAPGAVAKHAAEECGAGAIKGKKSELAERATALAQRTGWLPPSLRTVHYAAPGAEASA